MKEVHYAWRTQKIQDRLRVLMQRRSSATTELDALSRTWGLMVGSHPRSPGPSEPSYRDEDFSSPPPSSHSSEPGQRQPAAPPALDSLDYILCGPVPDDPDEMPLDEMVLAVARAQGWREHGTDEPAPLSTAPGWVSGQILTPRRATAPQIYTLEEARQRAAAVQREIEDLNFRIADVNRVLLHKARAETAARFDRVRIQIEAHLPERERATYAFDVDRFVRANHAALMDARKLAAASGTSYPDNERDFASLPRAVRDRLIRRIRALTPVGGELLATAPVARADSRPLRSDRKTTPADFPHMTHTVESSARPKKKKSASPPESSQQG